MRNKRTKKSKIEKKSASWEKRRKITAKQRMGRLAAATILTIAVIGALYGILSADHNSRLVGWNDNRTELAFNANENRLNFTVVGHSYYIDTSPVAASWGVISQIQKGLDYLKPAPARLADMLVLYIREKLK